MKRTLYLLHRWLGIGLCLFMGMWFFSGVVMMYVGYPKLTPEERLRALPTLDASTCCANLAQVLAASGRKELPSSVRLTSVAGRARFVLTYSRSDRVAVDALSAARIERVSAADAVASAQSFSPRSHVSYQDQADEDAWTHSKALDPHRPMHRLLLDDAAGTVVYVSSKTGEVVRDASATERTWNWVGAWIHWLYPFRGGALDAYWHDIVVYTSIVATVLSLTGMLVGVWRWRFSGKFRCGSRSPYREAWMRWHHLLGLLFGVTVVTFIFSGLMSMNPFKVLDSGAPRIDRSSRGDAVRPELFPLSAQEALVRFSQSGFIARELEWRMVGGAGYFLAWDQQASSRLLAGAPTGSGSEPFEAFDFENMRSVGSALMPQNKVVEVTVLRAYDFYYYQREPHTMSGGVKHLPILRLKFDDPQQTWIQLDPRTGALLNQTDSRRRWGRWLFAFLHSWDWLPLLERRPLWDVWMLALSLGGFFISVSGTLLGWRRLRRKWRAA